MGLFSWLFASDNTRSVKKLKKIADEVMALEPKYQAMTDDELKSQTDVLKAQLKDGKTLDDILPDAYAVVREASARVLKMKHYYVQVVGGIALHQGRIAEMKTGEGKTLVETLPAYLNALSEKGVHIVTVNEYLAKRDSEWMGKVFEFLGLKVGITLSGENQQQKKDAYLADITYGTNSEFGFDYLRDNMCVKLDQKVQRGHNFAVVDEVDSVLIDEARTPLIISGGKGFKNTQGYTKARDFVATLKRDSDVDIDEEKKQVRLTDSGIAKAERYYGVENISDAENMETDHYVNNALKARFMFEKDKNYIVDNGEVLIVDEFTGRIMAGRRYSDGIHEALEAKENVEIHDENVTVATITYQNYFRLYKKLSGMTGTAKTEETEFNKIYKLDVVQIPTNRPVVRKDYPDIVYANEKAKFVGIAEEVKRHHDSGQPVLIGTVTVEKSEELSKLLKQAGIKHVVLNAKNHEKESEIVAQAGKVGAVTIATNMAGRGTDILLGGNPEFLAKNKMKQEGFEEYQLVGATSFAPTDDEKILEAKKRYNELYESFKAETDAEKEKVIALGGLCIIGTERHESRRIDNQLRGRAGRQGDPGESVFYISLEDDLARVFGGERLKGIVRAFHMPEDQPLFQLKLISGQIENAQKRVEGANFASRRTLLQMDDVLNTQRTIIYGERDKVLEGDNEHDQIMDMVSELVDKAVRTEISDEKAYFEWDLAALNKSLEDDIFDRGTNFITSENIEEKATQDVVDMVKERVETEIEAKKKTLNELIPGSFDQFERNVLLQNVDNAWVEHIDAMQILKREILTQTDPVTSYKREGFDMFENMRDRIRENTAKFVIKARFKIN
ncbi:MAG: preprotein translocase subunit SecA, partial [Clostridia bacterium]|nr:preprotein translocase subunit SecA [Clostridia bacterium]